MLCITCFNSITCRRILIVTSIQTVNLFLFQWINKIPKNSVKISFIWIWGPTIEFQNQLLLFSSVQWILRIWRKYKTHPYSFITLQVLCPQELKSSVLWIYACKEPGVAKFLRENYMDRWIEIRKRRDYQQKKFAICVFGLMKIHMSYV